MAKKGKYYTRPDGLKEAIRTINGKRVAFRGKTDREVDRKILEYREEVKRGRLFSVVADEWEREKERSISESTRRVYSDAVKRLKAEFGTKRVSDIQPIDVQNRVRRFEATGRSAGTVQIELLVCKMIFDHAVIQGDISVSPAVAVKKSKGLPKKERNALTEEQEALVIASGRERTASFWLFPYLLLYTGMRRGEALALTYQDVDRKKGVIHVNKKVSHASGAPVLEHHTKSKNGMREIPLLPPLADALPHDRIGLIFPGRDGGLMTASEVQMNWKYYCRDVGLNQIVIDDSGRVTETFPITPHCLRHSFATICYEAGLDPRQAAQIMGHTPAMLEGVYTHLRESRRRTAAEKLSAHFSKASGD